MTWVCELTADAERDLGNLPRAVQRRVARTLTQMSAGPFEGSVKALRGAAWEGVFRRRIGDYRILFTADSSSKVVSVVRILIRSKGTYR